jgi:hypothetical protein
MTAKGGWSVDDGARRSGSNAVVMRNWPGSMWPLQNRHDTRISNFDRKSNCNGNCNGNRNGKGNFNDNCSWPT